MKQTKKYIVTALLVLSLLASLSLFAGCGDSVTYEDADRYTAGALSTDQTVTRVEIFWVSGNVRVEGVTSDKVLAYDTYPEGGALGLHHLLEDGVLRIYPCASGENVDGISKDLVVKLPYAMANALEEVRIETRDADVDLSLLSTDTLVIKTDAGNMSCFGTYKDVTVESVSGDLSLRSNETNALRFTSDSADAVLTLHTTGFTAVMTDGNGSFTADEKMVVHKDGDVFRFGDNGDHFVFTTESGAVHIGLLGVLS